MLMFADIVFSLPPSWNYNGNTWGFVSVARFIFANPVVVRAVGQELTSSLEGRCPLRFHKCAL